MTAPNAIKKSDIKRAVDLAKSENVIVEIERDGTKWRFMPAIQDIHSSYEVPKGKDVRL